jgi:phenylacetate-CoA ligase
VEDVIRGFLRTLRKTQFVPPEQMVQYQRGLLERLVRHARAHVPFYRESGRLDPLFRRDDTIDWERWVKITPVTRKDLQSYEALKSEHIPPDQGGTLLVATAGSTGEPVNVLASELARRWAWAALRLRDFEWHRIDTTKRLAFIYPFKHGYFDQTGQRRHANWNPLFGKLAPPGERVELPGTLPATQLIDAVDAVRPTYLQVQPTTLKLMVAHDHKRVLANLRLAAVFSYGEQFERESKDHVEAHLGCRVLDLFGTSECGYIAGSCPHCGGLHVHAEVALVETVAEDGSQAKPGETPTCAVIILAFIQTCSS